MAALTKAQFIKMVDKYTAAFLAMAPSVTGAATGATSPGWGDNTIVLGGGTDYGVQLKLRDAETLILGFQDADRSINNLQTIITGIKNSPQQNQAKSFFSPLLQALAQDCAGAGLSGVSSIDTFASYYNANAGGPAQALLPPDFATLHQIVLGSWPTFSNVYPNTTPQLTTPGLGNMAAAAWNNGTVIDITKYAGFNALWLVVTSTISGGPGTIKLSGNGFTYNLDGTTTPFTGTFSSHQLTFSVSGSTQTAGAVALTPASANDMYTAVTGFQFTTVSGGAFWVSGMSPTAAPAGGPGAETGTSVPTGTSRTSPPT